MRCARVCVCLCCFVSVSVVLKKIKSNHLGLGLIKRTGHLKPYIEADPEFEIEIRLRALATKLEAATHSLT